MSGKVIVKAGGQFGPLPCSSLFGQGRSVGPSLSEEVYTDLCEDSGLGVGSNVWIAI